MFRRSHLKRNCAALAGPVFGVFLITLSLLAQAAEVKPQTLSVADFQRTTFTEKDGAPDRTSAIAQTSDGWLWFGGSFGLTRFDGVHFEKVDIATSDGRFSGGVSTLYALPTGGLMIGHLSGGVTILKDGAAKRFDGDELREAGRPFDFVADQQGVIWGTFDRCLMRFTDETWSCIGPEWNAPAGKPREIFIDADGSLWLHALGSVARLRRGEQRFELAARVGDAGSLVQSQDGTFLFLHEVKGYSADRQWVGGRRDPLEISRKSSTSYIDGQGNLWSPFSGNLPTYAVAGIESLGVIGMFLQDADENVWATAQGRVHRLRRSAIVDALKAKEMDVGIGFPWIDISSDTQGVIWFVNKNESGVDSELTEGALWSVRRSLQPSIRKDIGLVSLVATDPNGNVWAASSQGLWELNGESFAKRADLPEAAVGKRVDRMAAGCAGGVWITVAGVGLLRFGEGGWQDRGGVGLLPVATPRSLHCDAERNLWLGYGDGRVARVDAVLRTTFLQFVGSAIGAISSISVGRHVLIGGEQGLALLRSEGLVRLSSRQKVLAGLTGIVEAPNGHVWLNGARGLVRVWSSDLDSAAPDIRTELFDANDGFPAPTYSLAMSLASIARDGSNRIWFAGHGGIAFIDAAGLRNPPSPRILIKGLTAGDRTFEVTDPITLPQGTRNVEVAYTALSFTHPERLRFRYRLDGVDDAWVNVEERRRAIYTNLPPGKHRFHVDVSDEFGSWTDRPSTLAFEIPPTFIQSRAFQVLCVATGFGLLILVYRLRMRQLERHHRQLLVERLDERERIARELHDTLLQGTQALILKVHSAAKLSSKDEPIYQVLDKALDQATTVMVEARNRIEDLRVRSGPDEDLAALLVDFGEELLQGQTVHFKALVQGSKRDLAPTVLREACLIGREALLNAVHHAKASTIELQIDFALDDLQLRVRDDGCGFDEKVLARPPGGRHWGLPGMQERARAMSGTVNIWSRPGAGTEVELRVPGSVAYVEETPRKRWSLRTALGYPA